MSTDAIFFIVSVLKSSTEWSYVDPKQNQKSFAISVLRPRKIIILLSVWSEVQQRTRNFFSPRCSFLVSTMSVRKMMRFFVRAVHPDIAQSLPSAAREVNQKSLMSLNAYIDRLDGDRSSASDPQKPVTPFVACSLPFFRPVQARRSTAAPAEGRQESAEKKRPSYLPNRARPLSLPLQSLPPRLSFAHRDRAAVQLIHEAQAALEEAEAGVFSSSRFASPHLKSLVEKPEIKENFTKHWFRTTHDEMFKHALYADADPAAVRREEAIKWFRSKYQAQLLRRALKLKSSKARRRGLEKLGDRVETRVRTKFGIMEDEGGEVGEDDRWGRVRDLGGIGNPLSDHAGRSPEQDEDAGSPDRRTETGEKIQMIEEGYHPDLVFMLPGLTVGQRREAIRRCCGMNLSDDPPSFWLLENIFKAMRGGTHRIPLIFAPRRSAGRGSGDTDNLYRAENGCVYVPYDFEVSELAALLEEELDQLQHYHEKLMNTHSGSGVSSSLSDVDVRASTRFMC